MALLVGLSSAQAAPKLAPLPPEVSEIEPNFYKYNRSWTRLRRWVKRNYGKKSVIEPLVYRNGVALITVVAKETRFKWTHLHFFKVGDRVRISVVARAGG
jgi:hypothetical protein